MIKAGGRSRSPPSNKNLDPLLGKTNKTPSVRFNQPNCIVLCLIKIIQIYLAVSKCFLCGGTFWRNYTMFSPNMPRNLFIYICVCVLSVCTSYTVPQWNSCRATHLALINTRPKKIINLYKHSQSDYKLYNFNSNTGQSPRGRNS